MSTRVLCSSPLQEEATALLEYGTHRVVSFPIGVTLYESAVQYIVNVYLHVLRYSESSSSSEQACRVCAWAHLAGSRHAAHRLRPGPGYRTRSPQCTASLDVQLKRRARSKSRRDSAAWCVLSDCAGLKRPVLTGLSELVSRSGLWGRLGRLRHCVQCNHWSDPQS